MIEEGVPAEALAGFPTIKRKVNFDLAHAAKHVGDLKRAFTKAVMQGGDTKASLKEIGLAGK